MAIFPFFYMAAISAIAVRCLHSLNSQFLRLIPRLLQIILQQLPVFATCPFIAATPTSFTNPIIPTVAFHYATYRLLTSINASLGSSGPPSCFPSPKSPNHARRPLLYNSLILGSESLTVVHVVTTILVLNESNFFEELFSKMCPTDKSQCYSMYKAGV